MTSQQAVLVSGRKGVDLAVQSGIKASALRSVWPVPPPPSERAAAWSRADWWSVSPRASLLLLGTWRIS